VRDAAFGDPRGVASVQGRFRSPVFEGDSLVVRTWLGASAHFDVVRQDGTCVLSHGRVTFRT
jgi:acyl-CoA thioesterase FadM